MSDELGVWDVSKFDEPWIPDVMHDKDKLDELMQQYHQIIFDSYGVAFHKFMETTSTNQRTFQMIYAAALMQVAATLAVDIGMSKEKFCSLAGESYDSSLGNAVKFG